MSNSSKNFYKKLLGEVGEKQAEKYLKKLKYKILEKNFQSNVGEIDIIAKDGDAYVFIEVKTRTSVTYGEPMEAVTRAKQRHIIRTAELYLYQNSIDSTAVMIRFDVIEIKNDNGDMQVNHIINAFGA